jgi:hypothetical protein
VRLPPRAPRKGTGQMRTPAATRVRVVTRCGCEPHPFRTRRDGREDKTPGPQPGSRGSIPRRGTQAMPGGRGARRPAVTRKAGVRAPPWQLQQHRSALGGREVQARGFARSRRCGCETTHVRCPVAEKFRRVAADHETRVRVPPGRPSQHRNTAPSRGRRPTARMPVRHIGDEGSSPSDHTHEVPKEPTRRERGRACPPTSTTS